MTHCTLASSLTLKQGAILRTRSGTPQRLKVCQGQVWATLGVAPSGRGNESGDYFLSVGESLTLQRGQVLVVESTGRGLGQGPAANQGGVGGAPTACIVLEAA